MTTIHAKDMQAATNSDSPASSAWQPRWRVDVGHGSEMGITVDDHCVVALASNEAGQWRPVTHIPTAVAQRIAMLARDGQLSA